MKIFLNKKKLIEIIQHEKNLGFVPTMGAIHKAHIYILKKSISLCNKTIVTIFVNKPQFNKKIDFQKYPRVLKKDISILKNLKIDCLYLPKKSQIYPNGVNKNITISSFGKKLCGKFRPGHFEAVADVIDRFIKIIKPKKIYFGEKDMQQLKIMEHFINKNHYKTKVVKCKTIREKNGLALSSRNFLLTTREKKIGAMIYRLLLNKKKNLIKNKITLRKIQQKIFKFLSIEISFFKTLGYC